MIAVTGWVPVSGVPDIAVDPYVPVTVTFPGYHKPEPLRSVVLRGAGGSGIVEIKVHAATGELVEVVVPAGALNEATGSSGSVSVSPEHQDAVPVLAFPDDSATYDADVMLSVHDDAVEIRIAAGVPATFGGTPEVCFGSGDAGELVTIAVQVSADQAAELLEG
jgi:hypothetical protein